MGSHTHPRYTDAEALAAAIAGGLSKFESKALSATRLMNAASGNVSYTGVGFKPTCLICFAIVTNTTFANWSFSDAAKSCLLVRHDHTGNYVVTGRLIEMWVAPLDRQRAVVASYDADGFTLTWTLAGTDGSTITLFFLALR